MMKKIEYQAPEMEVIVLRNQAALLAGSIVNDDKPVINDDGDPIINPPA